MIILGVTGDCAWAQEPTVRQAIGDTTLLAGEAPEVDYPTFGRIDRIDPRIDRLIPADARLEKLAEGFAWSEGPVWIRDGGYLLFSDVPNNAVMKWQEGWVAATVFLRPSGYTGEGDYSLEPGSNALVQDGEGRLVLCQHGDRRLTRIEEDGSWTTLADRFDGKRFNSPNDVVMKSDGNFYFTDPAYGLPDKFDSQLRELDICGVYRRRGDGTVDLLTSEMTRPNGIVFSPDERTLYVSQSDADAAVWRAFDVQADGTLANSRVFFDATELVKAGKEGLPDGMTVDVDGNLFATGPGGVFVFSPDGTHLGTIETGKATSNCTFGDDGRTLYITADDTICRIRTSTRGLGF